MSRGGIGTYIRKGDAEKTFAYGKCAYCDGLSREDRLSIDHINPIAKGGDSSLDNLTLACWRCNTYKQHFHIPEFIERVRAKREAVRHDWNVWSGRLLNYRHKKQENFKVFAKISGKITRARLDHTYFTQIINSLMNHKYLINE